MKWMRVLVLIVVLTMVLSGCGDYERPVSEQKAPASGNQKSTETVSVQKTEGQGNDISPSPEVKGSLRIQLEPTKVPSPTPEPTNPIEIASDARVDIKLQGLHDADEFVTVNVSLGMCDVDKLFKEQYPEVYDAYQMYKEATDYEYGKPWPTAAYEKYGDRLEELVLQGSELNNTLGRIWYEEQEAAFFSRHPELERCKTGGFLSIDMKLCYRDLVAIISDSAVEKIAFNDTEWHKPHVVGVYQGKEVYDLTAKVTRASLDVEPDLGVINSDVDGLSEIDDNAFLRVSFVLYKGHEDSEAEGKVKLDAAFEALMGYDWPIVEFVEVSRPDSWCERYLTILATKQQLEDIVVPDTSIYYSVYWEGYVRGALSDLEDGSVLPEE